MDNGIGQVTGPVVDGILGTTNVKVLVPPQRVVF